MPVIGGQNPTATVTVPIPTPAPMKKPRPAPQPTPQPVPANPDSQQQDVPQGMVPPVPQQPEPRAIILPWAPPPSGSPRSAMRKMRVRKYALNEGYHIEHRAPDSESGAPLHDVTANGIYPEDVYSHQGLRYYGTGDDSGDAEMHAKINRLKGKPKKAILIYRAIPHGLKGAKINRGDWVTLSKKYAIDHGRSALNSKYRILSKIVSAEDVYTNGDSWHEWGYDPVRGREQKPEHLQRKYAKPRVMTVPIERIVPEKDNMETAVHSLHNGRDSVTPDKPLKVDRIAGSRLLSLADGHHRLLRGILDGDSHVDVVWNDNDGLGPSVYPKRKEHLKLNPDEEHFGLGESLENGWLLNRMSGKRNYSASDDGLSMDFDSMGEDELPKAPLQRPAPKEDITGRTRKQILQQMLEAARKGHYDPSGMMPRDYIQDIENKDDVPQGGGDVFMSDPEDELPDRPAKMGRVRYARFPEQPPMLGRKDLKARWTEFTSDPDVDNRIWNHPAGNTSGGYNTSGSFSTVHSDDLRSHVKRLDDAGLNTHSHPMIRNDLQANRDEFGSHEVVVSPQMTAYAEKERRKPAGHFNDLIGTRLRFDHGVDHVGRPNALTHVFPPNQPTKMSRIGYPRRMARSSPEDTEALFKATQASPDDHNLRNALADTLANNGHPKSVIEHLRSGLPVWVGKSPKGVINAIPHVTKEWIASRPFGFELYHATSRNRRGDAHRVRANGKMQTWKTRPGEFRLPYKFGMYGPHGDVNHRNAHEFLIDDPTQEPA